MPISDDYKARLYPHLEAIAGTFGTPFHIYDEQGIQASVRRLQAAFSFANFQEFFAVKALPNPHILQILRDTGIGFDCSSIPELMLARQVGATGEDIFFTSNNTTQEEFEFALSDGGCILNLDDISLIEKVPTMPELICFRYNPGARRTGNSIIGNPIEAKYGVAHHQLEEAYQLAKKRGAKRFGLHAMIVSNERDYLAFVQTCSMLLELVESINQAVGIEIEFINLGGGLGIPYRPEDAPLDLESLADEVEKSLTTFKQKNRYVPHLYLESGRFVTAPHGVLVTRAINQKDTYRQYVGVDANMSALMRPAMYGAYHHIEVLGKAASENNVLVDVVGALCENNDKFAIQRALPPIDDGDLLIIQDTGAHGHSMGFNYNGRLRPQELLLKADGHVVRIRRAETIEDYFATLHFDSKTLSLNHVD